MKLHERDKHLEFDVGDELILKRLEPGTILEKTTDVSVFTGKGDMAAVWTASGNAIPRDTDTRYFRLCDTGEVRIRITSRSRGAWPQYFFDVMEGVL